MKQIERKLFGTDGVRGVANVHPMTTEIAMQIGRAIAFLVKNGDRRHHIVIGKDTRLSGYMLENALAAGICSMGVDVLLVGPAAHPGHRLHHHLHARRRRGGDLRLPQSLSGQRHQDLLRRRLQAAGRSMEAEIEELIFSQKMEALRPVAEEVGKAARIDDAKGRYIVFLKNTFPRSYTLDGFHIVLDCAHGATYKVAPHVFSELGAQVTTIGVEPDGTNINHDCGALHPECIADKVRQTGADIGLALDGDGDRLIVCDEKGNIVDGDHIMAICARELMARRKLQKTDPGGHGDEQHGPGGGHGTRWAANWCAPRSATATWWRRCGARATTSAASSRAT